MYSEEWVRDCAKYLAARWFTKKAPTAKKRELRRYVRDWYPLYLLKAEDIAATLERTKLMLN